MTSNYSDKTRVDDADGDVYPVLPENELQEGERVLVEIGEVEIAVFRTNDELHAVANYCPHQGGPLCEGPVSGVYNATEREQGDGWELKLDQENEIVVCPWHGWEFDMETGEHKAHSGTSALTYNVVVEDGQICLFDPKL